MKRKGFTLVELLAVIVILAVISIITIPLIGNVIEDSKKKALEQSVYGLVEAADYFTISNDGVYGFVFNEETNGKTEDGKYSLEYNGKVDAEGKLYIDKDGDISLCLMNEDYYVYKNYNSGIIIGDRSKDSCVARHDNITNKYIAYLESEGEGSSVYSKTEVDILVSGLEQKIDINNTSINSLTDITNTNKNTIEAIQNELRKYALQSDLEKTNNYLNYYARDSYIITPTTTFKDMKENCVVGMSVYNNGIDLAPSYGRGIILDIEKNALSILLVDDNAGKNMYVWSLIDVSDDTLISSATSKLVITTTELEPLNTLINANKDNISNNTENIVNLQNDINNVKDNMGYVTLANQVRISTSTDPQVIQLADDWSNYKYILYVIGTYQNVQATAIIPQPILLRHTNPSDRTIMTDVNGIEYHIYHTTSNSITIESRSVTEQNNFYVYGIK